MKMKIYKILCVCCLLATITILLGCSQRSEIEKTSKKYLEGFYSHDFKSLYDISTDSTLTTIKEIESRTRGLIDLDEVAVPEVIIHEYYIEGDTAYCRYTLMQDDDDTNAISENLMLIKKDNKWLVKYKFY